MENFSWVKRLRCGRIGVVSAIIFVIIALVVSCDSHAIGATVDKPDDTVAPKKVDAPIADPPPHDFSQGFGIVELKSEPEAGANKQAVLAKEVDELKGRVESFAKTERRECDSAFFGLTWLAVGFLLALFITLMFFDVKRKDWVRWGD